MLVKPEYYRMEKPIRLWRLVGHVPSNTYVGASQVLDSVRQVVNAKPGDELHCLPGGTFVSGPDGDFEVALRPTVPVFEAKYHRFDQGRFLEGKSRAGNLTPLQAPGRKVDYARVRAAARKAFPSGTAVETHVEPSAEIVALRGMVAEGLGRSGRRGKKRPRR